MPALPLLGREPANRLLAEAAALVARQKSPPTLVVFQVGEDAAAVAYVRSTTRTAAKAGVVVQARVLPAGTSYAALRDAAVSSAQEPGVVAVQVQNPLPEGRSLAELCRALPPTHDVEGLHPENQGLLFQGKPRSVPCTAHAVVRLLDHYEIPLAGRRVVVLGRSLAVGRPAALLCLHRDATVTLCHTKTKNLADEVRRGEIVIAAAGVPELVQADWIAPGAVVVDVGYHVLADGRTVGDVEASASLHASAFAPVPGGVGPLTVAELLLAVARAGGEGAAAPQRIH